jgi:hypothetical protein
MLIVNRHVLSSFENRKNVYALHTIFQKTDGKLRRWTKLGLLHYLPNTDPEHCTCSCICRKLIPVSSSLISKKLISVILCRESPKGKRIDFIMYMAGPNIKAETLSCTLPLPHRQDSQALVRLSHGQDSQAFLNCVFLSPFLVLVVLKSIPKMCLSSSHPGVLDSFLQIPSFPSLYRVFLTPFSRNPFLFFKNSSK